jgi:hypothetical protein
MEEDLTTNEVPPLTPEVQDMLNKLSSRGRLNLQ